MLEISTVLHDELSPEDQWLKVQADEDGRAFRVVLNHYIPQGQLRVNRILNICAGLAPEENELVEHFGITKSQLVSVELEVDQVLLGRKIGRETLVQGNLTERPFIESLGAGFGLVVGRNVPLNPGLRWTPVPEWVDIFRSLYRITEDRSSVFLTLLRDDEFDMGLEILQKVGFTNIKTADWNDNPVPSLIPGVAVITKDLYVILAEKPR